MQTLTRDYAPAHDTLERAVNLFRELHDGGGEAEALNLYAALIARTGTPGQARARYTQALAIAREISSPKDEADALDGIAATYRSEGDQAEARTRFQQALALYESLGCAADVTRVRAALDGLDAGSASPQ